MASGTLPTLPQADVAPAQGRYEDFIQKRLEQTRQQVRLVDVASSLMWLASGSLVFFLAVALLDHWVFSHGLNFIARLALFTLWVGVAGTYLWRYLLPSLINRVNPVFAAQTIEQTRPTLKNSLINFLLLRSHQQDVAPVVYRAMEHRAAADLMKVPVDHAVERGRIVHLACVLAAAVAVFALYLALSPKNPLSSVARVLFPWADVSVPTRVHIEDVKPGSMVVFTDDRQEITARVTGLRDGEEVALVAGTADNQVAEDRMVMTRTDEADHYRLELPAGGGGFQQDIFYRITAGDATSQTYKLDVQIAPTIVVDRIDYHYPAYTEKADLSIKNQGDIKALERTEVTIYATANMDIKEAWVDANCGGLEKHPMATNGAKAVGKLTLPEYSGGEPKSQLTSYQILFTTLDGKSVLRPVRYNVDVDRDLPPDIQFLEPKESEDGKTHLSKNGKLTIRLRALDSDYALRRVTLHAECKERELQLNWPVLLDRIKPDKAYVGKFDGEYNFRPADFPLKEGDVVRYWATADDNKEPRPNHSDTRDSERKPRTIQIEGAGGQQAQQDQPPNGEGQPNQGEGKPEKGGKGKEDQSNAGKGKGDSSGAKDSAASDGKGGAENGKPDNSDPTSKNRTSPDGKAGNGNDRTQPGKGGASGKDDRSSDAAKSTGERDSSDDGDQHKTPLSQTEQGADAIQDILDHQQEEKNKEQQNQPDSQDGKSREQGQKPDQKGPDQPGGSPQTGGDKPSGPQNGNQPDNRANGKQPGQQGNGDTKPQPGGSPQTGGDKPSGPQNGNQPDNRANGKQPGQQGSGDTKPQPDGGSNGSPSGTGKQPQDRLQNGNGPQNAGDEKNSEADRGQSPSGQDKTAEKSKGDASDKSTASGTPQSRGDKTPGKAQSENQSGSSKSVTKENAQTPSGGSNAGNGAGGEPKPDNKTAGGKSEKPGQSGESGAKKANQQPGGADSKEQTANGTPPNSKNNKQPGGADGKDQTANGTTPPNSKNNKPGGQGGPEGEQLAQNGARPDEKKPLNGGGGGSSSPESSGEKPGAKPKEKSGNSSGGGQGSQSKKEEKQEGGGSSGGGGDKTKPGQGDQTGDGDNSKKPGGNKPTGEKGSSSDNGAPQQDPGKHGDGPSKDTGGTPASQGDPHSNPGKTGDPKQGSSSDSAKSPGTSPHDSNSSSSNDGSLNGGGGAGGGQRGKKSGAGADGSQMPANNGGQVSSERGPGATGDKSGQVRSAESKGSSKHEQGKGNGETKESAEKQVANDNSKKPDSDSSNGTGDSSNPTRGGQPGEKSAQPSGGSGIPAGGREGSTTIGSPPQHEGESGPDAADLEFSKKQVDLALNHLKDELAKQKPELLNRLGWTKEEGQRFADNLQKLRDSAQKPGNEGQTAKKAYTEFLKNLDLHPHRTEIAGGKTKKDDPGHVQDSSQMEAPAEWRDSYHAYSRSTAGQK
jgi:hypothetical protein